MMGKKLLALLLCGALLVTVLDACGAPEGKEVICGTGQHRWRQKRNQTLEGRLSGTTPESGWYREKELLVVALAPATMTADG